MAKSKNWGLLGSTVLAALASPSAMAGNSVTISFAGDTAVPLDHWSTVLAFAMIAIAAYFLLRRQGKFGRLWQWIVLAIMAGAGTLGLQRYDLISPAYALIPGLTFPSPSTFINIPCNGSPFPVLNASGQTIRITGVTWSGIGTCSTTGAATPQCAPGLSLAAGANCNLQLTPSQPPA